MKRVTGIGGIFFKAKNPDDLQAWYTRHLGLPTDENGFVQFQWREEKTGQPASTVWSPFPADTRYFDPSAAPFMINYRVPDLRRLLAELKAEGVAVEERMEESEFGRFGWVMDPEGNRIELWEPPVPPETAEPKGE